MTEQTPASATTDPPTTDPPTLADDSPAAPDVDGVDAVDDPQGGGDEPDLGDVDDEGVPVAVVGFTDLQEVSDSEMVAPPADWDEDGCGTDTDPPGAQVPGHPLGYAGYVGGGFPASASPRALSVRTYRVPNVDTKISLALRADVAPILLYVATQFHRRVERLHSGWNWGYAFRAVRGSGAYSFHAAGVAIDLNAPRHPLGSSPSRTFNARQRAQIAAILREVAGTVRWGGNYSGRKDPMHFEIVASPGKARAVAARLTARPTAGVTRVDFAKWKAHRPSGGRPILKVGSHGFWVAYLQHLIGAKQDGDFGAATLARLRTVQKAKRLKVDGVCGTATWTALKVSVK
jgi:peptidoglycan hydrolase-like protein with peptidoglycan-binding domain